MPLSTSNLLPFDYQPRTRVIFGINAIERVGECLGELEMSKVLVVTDPGIVRAGHLDHLRNALKGAKVKLAVFDQVRENPNTVDVDACVRVARENQIDSFIGLGGGSSLDTAKGCNFLLTNGGRMQDYWGVGKAKKAMLPLIAIPTTAGTGSECQSAALIADEQTHQKMACLDPKVAARVAILDPALTLSQPARVTACTGIDALAHAVETAVTTRRTAISQVYSREAFKLCVTNLPQVLKDPKDVQARGGMLLGAAFAGMAIENSMLGAAHSAANPLTAHFGIVHGQAVGMMLPHVMRFNAAKPEILRIYRDLHATAGRSADFETLLKEIETLLEAAGMPQSLAECGIKRSSLKKLAEEASKQWTANFNPRPIRASDFAKLYEAAFQRCR